MYFIIQVGKVLSYDAESTVIRLDSVPEYPFTIEKSQEWCEEEDDVPEPDPSPYDADGLLEVNNWNKPISVHCFLF